MQFYACGNFPDCYRKAIIDALLGSLNFAVATQPNSLTLCIIAHYVTITRVDVTQCHSSDLFSQVNVRVYIKLGLAAKPFYPIIIPYTIHIQAHLEVHLHMYKEFKTKYVKKVHYVSVCTSILHAGGFSCGPMQNFYIVKHSTGLLVVNTGCNTKMIETCEK